MWEKALDETKEEMLDIFDESMNLLGSAPRSEVHEKGYWHQTFHCWVVSREHDQTYVLFQRRHPLKDTFPDKLDISCAGHLQAGETAADGVRELQEELGLSVSFDQLAQVGVIPDSGRDGQLIDNEFCHVFLYTCNQPLRQYKLQADEVVGLVKLEAREALKLLRKEVDAVQISGIELDASGQYRDVQYTAGRDQFVPHEASYYEKVFSAILDGRKAIDSARV